MNDDSIKDKPLAPNFKIESQNSLLRNLKAKVKTISIYS